MSMQNIIAVILLAIGAMGLAYGGISYPSDAHKADLGSLHLSYLEKERVNIPIWAGVTSILVGGVLFVVLAKNLDFNPPWLRQPG